MRSKHPFSRWIALDRAERYVERFGGKVFQDRLNGYTVLYSYFRQPLAFVRMPVCNG